MSDRPSLPPGDDSIRQMTEHYKQVNDRHEKQLAAVVTVTDEQRVAVAKELWAAWFASKQTHLTDVLYRFEADAKARLAVAAPVPEEKAKE